MAQIRARVMDLLKRRGVSHDCYFHLARLNFEAKMSQGFVVMHLTLEHDCLRSN